MYFKKFSNKEMQVIRQAIQEHGQALAFNLDDYEDAETKKELKAVEKLQKKLVDCYYLDRKGGAN
tara:strand:+ start:5371 stop:5565 length:195 start_codon:yes stop_codon:yes gene_type:complete